MTSGFPQGFINPVLEPADIEWLAMAYLTPYMGATPVATRVPNPANNADTVNGFLRVEDGGGADPNPFWSNLTWFLHGYSPDEVEASQICRTAFKWARAARGQSIAGYYVNDVCHAVPPHRLSDPNVIGLTRYRAMITWQVPGLIQGS